MGVWEGFGERNRGQEEDKRMGAGGVGLNGGFTIQLKQPTSSVEDLNCIFICQMPNKIAISMTFHAMFFISALLRFTMPLFDDTLAYDQTRAEPQYNPEPQ